MPGAAANAPARPIGRIDTSALLMFACMFCGTSPLLAQSLNDSAIPIYADRPALAWALCSIDEGDSSRDARVEQMVRSADAIIVAIAQRAATATELRLAAGAFGHPVRSAVVFSTVQVLRGKSVPDTLVIDGELTDRDDFNSYGAPYPAVRPSGERGSCFAEEYRRAAAFLLVLHRDDKGRLTPYWWPLLPSNEQLHQPRDLWLAWVRSRLDDQQLRH